MRVIILFLCLVSCTFDIYAVDSKIVIKKCCNYGESLNLQTQCSNETDYNDSDWFPKNPFIIYSSKNILKIVSKETALKTVQSVYSGKVDIGFPGCDNSLRDIVVAWKDPELEGQFYMIYDSHKRVKLNIKRESVYHDNVTVSFTTPFTPDAYCVDSGPSESYVALVCPCNEVTCIRKCCHQEAVYDEKEQRCVTIDDLNITDTNFQYDSYKDWRPTFEPSPDDNDDEVEYFLLPGKHPPCTEERGVLAEWGRGEFAFQFLENGNVKMNLTDGSMVEVLAGDYCADYGWKSGKLVPLLLRCFTQKVVEDLKSAEDRVEAYGVMLIIAALLLSMAAATIAFSGELEERFAARPQLAHVACLALAHFVAGINTFLSGGKDVSSFCIFSGNDPYFFIFKIL